MVERWQRSRLFDPVIPAAGGFELQGGKQRTPRAALAKFEHGIMRSGDATRDAGGIREIQVIELKRVRGIQMAEQATAGGFVFGSVVQRIDEVRLSGEQAAAAEFDLRATDEGLNGSPASIGVSGIQGSGANGFIGRGEELTDQTAREASR